MILNTKKNQSNVFIRTKKMKKLLTIIFFALFNVSIALADKVPFSLIIDNETAYSCNNQKENKNNTNCENSEKIKITAYFSLVFIQHTHYKNLIQTITSKC